jgi:hypothetical protein
LPKPLIKNDNKLFDVIDCVFTVEVIYDHSGMEQIRVTLNFVLFGCEIWLLTVREESRPMVFENRVLR